MGEYLGIFMVLGVMIAVAGFLYFMATKRFWSAIGSMIIGVVIYLSAESWNNIILQPSLDLMAGEISTYNIVAFFPFITTIAGLIIVLSNMGRYGQI